MLPFVLSCMLFTSFPTCPRKSQRLPELTNQVWPLIKLKKGKHTILKVDVVFPLGRLRIFGQRGLSRCLIVGVLYDIWSFEAPPTNSHNPGQSCQSKSLKLDFSLAVCRSPQVTEGHPASPTTKLKFSTAGYPRMPQVSVLDCSTPQSTPGHQKIKKRKLFPSGGNWSQFWF